jgi:undecaprenyl diphosphate synthase
MSYNNKEKNKNIPTHVGIIPDGNRRWAEERNLSNYEGHERGYEKLKQSVDWFFSRGVNIVSVYTFSTENWNRAREEVNYLMKLLRKAIDDETERAIEKNFRIIISGRIDELPGDLPEACVEAMNKTKKGSGGILNLCLNYGGRAEIVDAVKKMIKNKISIEQVHEGMIRKYLYNGQLPDPDVIVRTSGEKRLSGFQLWQAAYSELVFLNKYWPDFEAADVDMVLEEFARRKRRFGR